MLTTRYKLNRRRSEAHFFHDVVSYGILERAYSISPGGMTKAFYGLFTEEMPINKIESFSIKWGIPHLLVILNRPADLRIFFRPGSLPQYQNKMIHPRVSVQTKLRDYKYNDADNPVTDVFPRISKVGETYKIWEWGIWTQHALDIFIDKTPIEIAELFFHTECIQVLNDLFRLEIEDINEKANTLRKIAEEKSEEEQAAQERRLNEDRIKEFDHNRLVITEDEKDRQRTQEVTKRITGDAFISVPSDTNIDTQHLFADLEEEEEEGEMISLDDDDDDTLSEDEFIGDVGSETMQEDFNIGRCDVGYDDINIYCGLSGDISIRENKIQSLDRIIKKAKKAIRRYEDVYTSIAPMADRMSAAELKSLMDQAYTDRASTFMFPARPVDDNTLMPFWMNLKASNHAKDLNVSAGASILEEYRHNLMKPFRMYKDSKRRLPILRHKRGRVKKKLKKLRKKLKASGTHMTVHKQASLVKRIMGQVQEKGTDILISKRKSRFSMRALQALGILAENVEPIALRKKGFWAKQSTESISEMSSIPLRKYEFSLDNILPIETYIDELRINVDFEIGWRQLRRLAANDWLDEHIMNIFGNIVMARQKHTEGSRIQIHGTRMLERLLRYEVYARKGIRESVPTRDVAGSGVITPPTRFVPDKKYQEKYHQKLMYNLYDIFGRSNVPRTHYFIVHSDGNHFMIFIIHLTDEMETVWGYFDSCPGGHSGIITRNRLNLLLQYMTQGPLAKKLPDNPDASLVYDQHRQTDSFNCGVYVAMFLVKKLLFIKKGMPGIRSEELIGFRRVMWTVLRHFHTVEENEVISLDDE